MRNGFLGSMAGLLTGATLTLAQSPLPAGPATADVKVVSAVAVPGPLSPGVIVTGPGPAVVPAGGCPSCGGNGGGAYAGGVVGDLPSPYSPRPCSTEPNCGTCNSTVHLPEHVYAPDLYVTGGASYLNWWIKNGKVAIPLVTTAPGATLPLLGQPTTTGVFGDQALNYHEFSGGRLWLDFWHDGNRDQGVEAGFFMLGDKHLTFTAEGNAAGSPAIGIPFNDILTGSQHVSLVSFPGAFAGGVTITSHSSLWGAEGNALWKAPVFEGQGSYIWLVGGFRYLDLGEDLSINQRSSLLGGGALMLADGTAAVVPGGISGPPAGSVSPTQVLVNDLFQLRNQFWGGQVGVRAEQQFGDAFVVVDAKIALGGTEETAKIVGATAFTPPSPTNNLPAGLFAVANNVGRYTHTSFSVLPTLGVQAGFYLTSHVRAHVGYDFLYLTAVARPGDQLDNTINRAAVPTSLLFGLGAGPGQPSFTRQETDFWAQGVSIGLDFSY